MGFIPLKNGLLNLESLELDPFSPDKSYTFQLPVEYDPRAGFSHIEQFFTEVLHPEDIKTMQSFFGYTLYPSYPAHKMIWMLGNGRNGKTTTGNLLRELVGAENVAGVPLNQLDGNYRFSIARLFGKLLNIIAEPETKAALQTPTLKAAIGGDLIFGEKKGIQETFKFTNFAKFMIYANRVPPIDDASFAFWERILVIDFPFTFTGDNAKKDLYKTLIEQDGLAGLLNWALIGLKQLKATNWEFSETTTQKNAKENMKRRSQPVSTFVDEWTEYGNRAEISKECLFDAFRMYCDIYDLIIPHEKQFTLDLKRVARVHLTNPRIKKTRVLIWQGIKLRGDLDVVTTAIDGKPVSADEIGKVEDADIDFMTTPLADFLSGQLGVLGRSYFILHILGERRIIIENKELIPLYMEKLETYLPMLPANPPIEKAICDRCGRERRLTFLWVNEGVDSLICDGCASELKEEIKEKSKNLLRDAEEQKELGEYSKNSTGNGEIEKKKDDEAEELKGEAKNKSPKIRGGISTGPDIEYLDLSEIHALEDSK